MLSACQSPTRGSAARSVIRFRSHCLRHLVAVRQASRRSDGTCRGTAPACRGCCVAQHVREHHALGLKARREAGRLRIGERAGDDVVAHRSCQHLLERLRDRFDRLGVRCRRGAPAASASRSAALTGASRPGRCRLRGPAPVIIPAPAVKLRRRIDQDEAAGRPIGLVAVEHERPRGGHRHRADLVQQRGRG